MTNSNLNVLLTRPKEKSLQLANEITSLASSITIEPLFDYQAGQDLASLNQQIALISPEIFIFISPAAVAFSCQSDTFKRYCQSVTLIAVGDATGKALQQQGFNNIAIPSTHTSEGLLQLVQLQHCQNKHVMILRGNGGRELIKQALEQQGAIVAYNEVYKRCWFDLSSQQTFEKWRKDNINCIVVTSSAILEKMMSYIDDKQWAKQCTWVVASARIAQQARQFGLTNVVNAQGASHKHIKLALTSLHK